MVDVVSLPSGIEWVTRDIEEKFVGQLEELGGGRTDRNVDPDYVFQRWSTTSKPVTAAVTQEMRAFFRACRQAAYAVLFYDCIDNSFTDVSLAALSSGTTQLRKGYSNGVRTYYHPVFFPRADTVTIKEGGVLVDAGEYTVGATGLITFTGSPLPTGALTASCTAFDKPVIFDGPLRISPGPARHIISATIREIYPV